MIKLRQQGWSFPKIAEVLGVDSATVYRDRSIFANAKIENPPVVQHAGGKRYPARQRTETERQELVRKLRQRGLSIPRIAELLGVGEATVYRDLSVFPNEKTERPSESTGADGKAYPAHQRTAGLMAGRGRAQGSGAKAPPAWTEPSADLRDAWRRRGNRLS